MSEKITNINKLLTFQDVADRLGVTDVSVRRYVIAGKISCLRIGGRVRFLPEHVQEFVKEIPAKAART